MRRGILLAVLFAGSARAAAPVAIAPIDARLSSPAPAVDIPGMTWASEQAYSGWRRLPELGRGEFGVVYDHPTDPDAVVKLVADNRDSAFRALVSGLRSRKEKERDSAEEARDSVRLAAIGAGPALLGVARVPHRLAGALGQLASLVGLPAPDWSRPALVKERIHGETFAQLERRHAAGPEEMRLASELWDRMSRAGAASADLSPHNVMIGTTASQPERRAWLVDPGFLQWAKPGAGR